MKWNDVQYSFVFYYAINGNITESGYRLIFCFYLNGFIF